MAFVIGKGLIVRWDRESCPDRLCVDGGGAATTWRAIAWQSVVERLRIAFSRNRHLEAAEHPAATPASLWRDTKAAGPMSLYISCGCGTMVKAPVSV